MQGARGHPSVTLEYKTKGTGLNKSIDWTESGAAMIKVLMTPRSIAFVGASADLEKQSGQPLRNTLAAGYKGKVFAVNRRGVTIGDIQSYPSALDIPESVDIGFVTVPASECAQAVRELGLKGAKVAVVAVGGFAETGSEQGRRFAEELRAASVSSGVRLVGPICNGLYNTSNGLALGYNAIHQRTLEAGRVAFISHSGALASPFIMRVEQAGAGLSSYVSAGCELDLGLADFISYFAADPQTNVIALILDHVGNGDHFLAAVRQARRAGKQIVALKLGNTALGREATLAHSSNLSGQRHVYEAVFANEGIRLVPTVESLALTCAILSAGRHRVSGGAVATSTSGGGAIVMADLFSEQQVPVAKLAPQTVAEISSRFRFDAAHIMNPYDLGLGGRQHYIANVASLANDPSAGVLVVFGTPVPQLPDPDLHTQLAKATVDVAEAHPDLPIIYLSPAPLFNDERRILEQGKIPVCGSALDVVAVAKALMPIVPVPEHRASHAGRRLLTHDLSGPLSEHRSKMLLRSFAIPVAAEKLVHAIDEACDAAEEIGFPVVLKASGHGIWHKSENQLVELDIKNRDALYEAWLRLRQRVARLQGIKLDGFLVGKFLAGGIEAIVGVSRDPEFGPIAVVGPGGVLAELFGSAGMRHLALPLTADKVVHALKDTPLGRLSAGYRGSEPLDLDAFAALVAAAAAMAVELGDEFQELDLNPVKILPAGKGAWAVDALCVLRGSGDVAGAGNQQPKPGSELK